VHAVFAGSLYRLYDFFVGHVTIKNLAANSRASGLYAELDDFAAGLRQIPSTLLIEKAYMGVYNKRNSADFSVGPAKALYVQLVKREQVVVEYEHLDIAVGL
jgi:hypothetical protein